MKMILDNWHIILALIAVLIVAVVYVCRFLGLPTNEQKKKIKKWLLQAVCVAEKKLGSQTGKLKLSMVYDMFVATFPVTASLMNFNTFSKLVDEALDEMRSLLESNAAVKNLVLGSDINESKKTVIDI